MKMANTTAQPGPALGARGAQQKRDAERHRGPGVAGVVNEVGQQRDAVGRRVHERLDDGREGQDGEGDQDDAYPFARALDGRVHQAVRVTMTIVSVVVAVVVRDPVGRCGRVRHVLCLGLVGGGWRASPCERQVLNVRDGFVEQLADVVVVQRIHHVPALAPAGDQPQMAQQAELVGDRRALHTDVLSQFADRARAGVKPSEDAQSARRSECLHRVGDDPREALVEFVGLALGSSVCHAQDYS
jgi:hypothetical protein